jgi:hypothetical protein
LGGLPLGSIIASFLAIPLLGLLKLCFYMSPITCWWIIIVSGGLTLAEGFVKKIEEVLSTINFPVRISEVRRAIDPLRAVAQGALLAASL